MVFLGRIPTGVEGLVLVSAEELEIFCGDFLDRGSCMRMAWIPCVLEAEGEEEEGASLPGELLTGGRDRPIKLENRI